MTDKENIEKANLTTANTDTETGCEGLDKQEDKEQSIRALKDMYKSGLIPDDVFKEKMAKLEKE